MKKLFIIILASLLSSCVYSPKYIYIYNYEGKVTVKQSGSNADDSLNGNKASLSIPLIK